MARILIVDDEPDVLKALRMRLKSEGYDVIHATDGATATQTAIRERPDLIILDIGMPAGDGHTVAARLGMNTRTRDVPVIYLTARASEEDRRKAQEAGAAAYIVKPYRANELLALVASVLSA